MNELNMAKKWPELQKTPVVMVICQVVFEGKETISLLPEVIVSIQKTLPKQFLNMHTNLNLNLSAPLPLGESTVKAGASTQVSGSVYHTEDQRQKLEITSKQITYIDETAYKGFDKLKDTLDNYLKILEDYLRDTIVKRVSIRFINRFSFTEFNDVTEYFKTFISTAEDSVTNYPVVGYGFKWFSQIADNTRAIVNQELNNVVGGKFDYLFDIDVLCDSNLIFDKAAILNTIDELREIKNDLFFSNLTRKTIDLCNS